MDTKWGPAKRKKLLSKPPFTQLFENGFSRNGEMAVGVVQGYIITIFYTWTAGKSAIHLNALFDTGFHVHSSEDVLKDIIYRNPPANRFSMNGPGILLVVSLNTFLKLLHTKNFN
jgi:hypothetical protein